MLSATRYRTAAEISRQSQLSDDISKIQEAISSGKKIGAPSDDPISSGRISEIRQAQADQTVYLRNVDTGAGLAAQADTQLKAVNAAINRAKELVLAGRNQATSDSDRTSLATEMRGLAEDIGSYATATDSTGRSIFPTVAPLAIPVSESLSLAPTQIRDAVFGGITTGAGVKSIADILGIAADQLEGKSLDGWSPAPTTSPATPADPLTGDALVAARDAALSTALDVLDTTSDHVINVAADQGIRAQRLDDAKESLTASSQTLTEERSGLESTDLTTAISEFQAKQTALQAAQAVFAQTNKHSLFDLLG